MFSSQEVVAMPFGRIAVAACDGPRRADPTAWRNQTEV